MFVYRGTSGHRLASRRRGASFRSRRSTHRSRYVRTFHLCSMSQLHANRLVVPFSILTGEQHNPFSENPADVVPAKSISVESFGSAHSVCRVTHSLRTTRTFPTPIFLRNYYPNTRPSNIPSLDPLKYPLYSCSWWIHVSMRRT